MKANRDKHADTQAQVLLVKASQGTSRFILQISNYWTGPTRAGIPELVEATNRSLTIHTAADTFLFEIKEFKQF